MLYANSRCRVNNYEGLVSKWLNTQYLNHSIHVTHYDFITSPVCQHHWVHSSDSTRVILWSRISTSCSIRIPLVERNESAVLRTCCKFTAERKSFPVSSRCRVWAIASSTCLCWATQVPVIYRPPWAGKARWSFWDFTDSVSFHYTKGAPSNLIFREESDCFSFVLLRHFSLTWVIKLQKLSTQLSCLFVAAHTVLWSAGSVLQWMSVY